MHKRLVTWESIEEKCSSLAKQISTEYAPDLIIGIAKGGLVPARLLANYLDVSRILSLGVSSYSPNNEKTEEIVYQNFGDREKHLISKSRVLLVDDLSDTGDTFARVMIDICDHIVPRELQSACLFVKPNAKYVPDFFCQKLKTNSWIVFPWERELISLSIKENR